MLSWRYHVEHENYKNSITVRNTSYTVAFQNMLLFQGFAQNNLAFLGAIDMKGLINLPRILPAFHSKLQ